MANGPCTYESTSVYYYSNFQYIFMAVLFARGKPWKASILTNYKFTGWAVLCVGVSMALLFSEHQGSFFRAEEVPITSPWRGYMFLLMLLNVALNLMLATWLFPMALARYKQWAVDRWKKSTVYGRSKPMEGPRSKLYHRLRGEFERGWDPRNNQ